MRATRLVTLVILLILLVIVVDAVLERRSVDEDSVSRETGVLPGGTPIFSLSDTALDSLLETLDREGLPLDERVRVLAVGRVGTPYERDCLGEEEGVDPDPLFRVDSTDCTVFILTLAALSHAPSVAEARRNMRVANYRDLGPDDPPSYDRRLHFTVDRLRSSPYFEDVTAEVAGASRLRDVTLTLNRREDGSRLLPIDWEEEVTVSYVPAGEVGEDLLGRLPPVVGVAAVRDAYLNMGLVTAHEGLLLDGREFIHASSDAGEVVSVPFLRYLFPEDRPPRFDGVIFYRIR